MGELGERFPAVLADAAGGDSAAFAELWRAAHPPLLRYLRVIAEDAAEDVASETWLKAMRGLPSFVGDEPAFRGWLTVIGAQRRPVTWAGTRRDGRRRCWPTRNRRVHVTAPDAADQALERLGTERALRLLATLPPAQAEMVALRVIVGLEPAEIALIVGRSAGAVRVAVHRALADARAHARRSERGRRRNDGDRGGVDPTAWLIRHAPDPTHRRSRHGRRRRPADRRRPHRPRDPRGAGRRGALPRDVHRPRPAPPPDAVAPAPAADASSWPVRRRRSP